MQQALWKRPSLRAAALALMAVSLTAQAPAAAPADKPYKAPRNAFGAPDISGSWTNNSMTPLERPAQYGERRALTEDEVRQMEGARAEIVALGDKPIPRDVDLKDVPCYAANTASVTRAYNGANIANCGYDSGFTDHGNQVMRVAGEPRTSLITYPANGRMPPRAAGAPPPRAVVADPEAGPAGPTDNPEDRSLGDRCITSFGNHAGPVMLPSFYNNGYEIVQGKDAVAIEVEMVHDVRIIRLNARHGELPQWYGDSIGHYEGDTLVVETINYHPLQNFRGSNRNLKVTERFTRVAPDRLKYEFRVEDPTVWSQPWGGEYEFTPYGRVYEYACHEGNYALYDILAGARAEEGKDLAGE